MSGLLNAASGRRLLAVAELAALAAEAIAAAALG